jgi:predicted amidohydrolase YtcJ
MIDERDPPALEALAGRIAWARAANRAVAAHCVTGAELALYLAALDLAGGAMRGDRIEHGAVIDDDALLAIAASGLTVVTNPVFVPDRGDRYLEVIPSHEHADLCRLASLARAGVPLAAGSDAPYASVDPWRSLRAARDRRTASGARLGAAEALGAAAALRLYLKDGADPGGAPRRLTEGAGADLMLCRGDLPAVLDDLSPDRIDMTVIGGEIAFARR